MVRYTIGLTILAGIFFGCATMPQRANIKDSDRHIETGQIIAGTSGAIVTFDDMITDLANHRVIYVGENHSNVFHHNIQLRILKALHEQSERLTVGMEMFDVTYQSVLDQWTEGHLSQEDFIQQSHWYANWRYDYMLYEKILSYTKDNHIPLIGLNIPFHIPRKIRIGGIDSLLGSDRENLPDNIDTSNPAHKAHIEDIFNQHPFHGDTKFDFFYQAQCVWEDTMAYSVARHLGSQQMVILAGNGHIINRFGIPDRAYKRTEVPYRSVYLASAGETIELSYADYIWVTPTMSKRGMR